VAAIDGHPVGTLGCRRRNKRLKRLSSMAASAANLQHDFAFRLRFGPGLKVRQKSPTSPLFEWPPLFLLFFTGNYQRQTIAAPQKCSIAGGVVKERTARQRPIRAGSSARWQK
jgi:hypothetical protein